MRQSLINWLYYHPKRVSKERNTNGSFIAIGPIWALWKNAQSLEELVSGWNFFFSITNSRFIRSLVFFLDYFHSLNFLNALYFVQIVVSFFCFLRFFFSLQQIPWLKSRPLDLDYDRMKVECVEANQNAWRWTITINFLWTSFFLSVIFFFFDFILRIDVAVDDDDHYS